MSLAARILNLLFLFLIARLFTDHFAFRFQIFPGKFFHFWRFLFPLATVFRRRCFPFSKLPVKNFGLCLAPRRPRGATEYPESGSRGAVWDKFGGPFRGPYRGRSASI